MSLSLRPDLAEALDRRARATGTSPGALCERVLEEALSRPEHPLIVFRDEGGGRRAALLGSQLTVPEVIDAVMIAEGDDATKIRMAADRLQIPANHVRACLQYHSAHEDEVDDGQQHAAEGATRRVGPSLRSSDLDRVVAAYTDDAVLVAPEGTYRGREAIGRFFRNWMEPFSELEFSGDRVRIRSGSIVMIHDCLSYRHTGPYRLPSGDVLSATGKRVSIRSMELMVIDDHDLMAEHRLFYDRLELLAQLGAG